MTHSELQKFITFGTFYPAHCQSPYPTPPSWHLQFKNRLVTIHYPLQNIMKQDIRPTLSVPTRLAFWTSAICSHWAHVPLNPSNPHYLSKCLWKVRIVRLTEKGSSGTFDQVHQNVFLTFLSLKGWAITKLCLNLCAGTRGLVDRDKAGTAESPNDVQLLSKKLFAKTNEPITLRLGFNVKPVLPGIPSGRTTAEIPVHPEPAICPLK